MLNIHDILAQYWGFDQFRPLQEEIIQSILEHRDTLALLPTGGGKSICFQVPALATEGICIVVSPLIALMKDQVSNLKSRGIKAEALFSGMYKSEIDIVLDNCIYGKVKFLYLSPERLASDLFLARFEKMNVSFIAVDEAHCISQWGYDFRPAYLNIAALRVLKPDLPIIALTATATPDVVNDIQVKLLFQEENVFQKSFSRSNLSYSVLYEEAKMSKLIDILEKVNGSAIVYVQNRKQTKEVAEYIYNHNISSNYYHAGLNLETRDKRQQEWLAGDKRVMVATNAFGMGIDKPDVRLVVHITLPDSLEAYFQEAGRAGRDGKKAYAVLLTNNADKLKTESKLVGTMPSIQEIKQVYDGLGNFFQLAVGAGKDHSFAFDIADFCGRNKIPMLKTYNALKFLEYDAYLSLSETVNQSAKVLIKCSKLVFNDFLSRQTEHKDLLQLLLRSYGGMFDNFTNIKEKFIASKLNVSLAELNAQLKQLEKENILIYHPQTDKPFIYFVEDRLPINDLLLDVKNIKNRIKIFETKHQEILHYATTKDICRNVLLLAYFGEKDSANCGICDVCLGRNLKSFDDKDLSSISAKVKFILSAENMNIETLSNKVYVKNTDKFLLVLKYLMSIQFVLRNNDGTLSWNSDKKS